MNRPCNPRLFRRATVLPVLFLATLSFVGEAASVSEQPQQLVMQTTERMVGVLRAERERLRNKPGCLYSLVGRTVLPHFDFDRISRWVLGRYWRGATPEQQERFRTEFQKMLVRSYASALFGFVEEEITYLPLRQSRSDKEAIVRTEVHQSGGIAIPVDYRLHLTDSGWKVFDVRIDGISLVANYRLSFSRQVHRQGIDSLIENLARKNQSRMQ